jgi:hypothetical protein
MISRASALLLVVILAFVAIVGVIVLACLDKTIPTELTTLATGLVAGALALAQGSSTVSAPVPATPLVVPPQKVPGA